jgi:hypothetical protein
MDARPEERFPTLIKVRAPQQLKDAVERAADQHMTTPSEFVRRTLIERLQLDSPGASAFAA